VVPSDRVLDLMPEPSGESCQLDWIVGVERVDHYNSVQIKGLGRVRLVTLNPAQELIWFVRDYESGLDPCRRTRW
jgi:hypothetical protein